LYEMLTGKHPFVRDTVAATAFATISGKYDHAGTLTKEVPRQLDTIIAQCLTSKPDDRVKTAGQLIELLKNVVPMTGAGSGAWPVLENKKNGFAGMAVSGVASIVALIKRAAPKKTPPPTLVSTRIRTAPHRSSPVMTKIRNAFRMESFIVRKIGAKALQRIAEGVSLRIIGAVAIAGALVVAILLLGLNRDKENGLYIPITGLDNEQKTLAGKSQSWVAAGTLDSALVYANALAATEEGASRGHFLAGIIACRQGEFDNAFVAFETAQRYPSGAKLLERNRAYIVSLCLPVLEKNRAPDPLVSILAKIFSASEVPYIKKAVYEKPYWLRWNSLRILQAAGKQVDLVRVFILDLKYSRTMKTRIQAIRDLGDLKDKRAVPALREAAGKGMRDPFVSSAAARTLKEVFKEK
jgi:hypothetical protein